jgi:hypothetical protein
MFEIGDLDGDMDGDMDGDILGDSLVGDDILGDSLVGDDYTNGDDSAGDSLVGFSNPFRRRRKQALIAKKRAANATLLKALTPSTKRNWFIGLFQAAIAASAAFTITALPQVTFRARRLSIPAQFAANFVINSIVIGVAFQQAAFTAVPATMFTETATGTNLGLGTCQIGQAISIAVQNIDTLAAHDFRGGLIGVAVIQQC